MSDFFVSNQSRMHSLKIKQQFKQKTSAKKSEFLLTHVDKIVRKTLDKSYEFVDFKRKTRNARECNSILWNFSAPVCHYSDINGTMWG